MISSHHVATESILIMRLRLDKAMKGSPFPWMGHIWDILFLGNRLLVIHIEVFGQLLMFWYRFEGINYTVVHATEKFSIIGLNNHDLGTLPVVHG